MESPRNVNTEGNYLKIYTQRVLEETDFTRYEGNFFEGYLVALKNLSTVFLDEAEGNHAKAREKLNDYYKKEIYPILSDVAIRRSYSVSMPPDNSDMIRIFKRVFLNNLGVSVDLNDVRQMAKLEKDPKTKNVIKICQLWERQLYDADFIRDFKPKNLSFSQALFK